LGDQVAGVRADDAGADQPLRLAVEQQLREPVRAAERQRAPAGGPRERALLVTDAACLRVVLGNADPRDLRVGIRDGRNHSSVEEAFLARRGLGGDLAFVRGLVGEHRRADDVADREDVRHVRAHLPVDLDEAPLVDGDPRGVGTYRPAVRPAADRDEHPSVDLFAFGRGLSFEADRNALLARLRVDDARAEHDRLVPLREALLERPDEIAVAARNQSLRQLDDRYAHAERVVYRRHLEADDAAADDEHALGQILELERAGRIHDPRIVGQVRQADRLRARGDDALIEIDGLRFAVADDLDPIRADEPARAVHDAHLALLRHAGEAAGELTDDAVLPVAELAGIDMRPAEIDAVRGHLLRFLDHARRMQKRLRRNAADVQTDAAERRPALDQRDVESEIGGAEGRGVAARSRAEHDDPGTGASAGGRRPGMGRLGLRRCRARSGPASLLLRAFEIRARRLSLEIRARHRFFVRRVG